MRTPPRRPDDGDVIRARLRALLAEGQQRPGWVPGDAEDRDTDDRDTDDLPTDDLPTDDLPTDDPDTGDGDDEPARDDVHPDVSLPAGFGRHRAPGPTARLDPGRPGAWALWAVAVLAALAVVGWTWWDRPTVDQVPGAATTTTRTTEPPSGPSTAGESAGESVVVSVVGQVAAPGLVTLPAGSRVADALAAAGGLLPEADPAAVNAAAVLSDGQQVAVGVAGAPGAAGAAAATGSGGGLLDLNTATAADLDALPGIGPVLAQRIVDHRTEHGPFTSVDELDDVSGIGPAIFADLVDRVRV